MVSNCNGFHRVCSGDTCYDIAAEAGIWIIQLYAWNPAVGTDCSGLWLGYHVCISVMDQVSNLNKRDCQQSIKNPVGVKDW